jgi:hypothetical protein
LEISWFQPPSQFHLFLANFAVEYHMWFEDWWMVASLCDEWLTTLCGLILG